MGKNNKKSVKNQDSKDSAISQYPPVKMTEDMMKLNNDYKNHLFPIISKKWEKIKDKVLVNGY